MEKKMATFIDYKEIESLMAQAFGAVVSWCDVDWEPPANDSAAVFDVDLFPEELGIRAKAMKEVQDWALSLDVHGRVKPISIAGWSARPGPNTMLRYLATRGLIEPGLYVVEVSW